MERLSVIAALAITLTLSLTLGAFGTKAAPNGHLTYMPTPNSDTRARF